MNSSKCPSGSSELVSFPDLGLTLVNTVSSETGKLTTGVLANAPFMYSNQMGIAARDPVSFLPRGLPLSLPTHTPVSSLGVYPRNQAST